MAVVAIFAPLRKMSTLLVLAPLHVRVTRKPLRTSLPVAVRLIALAGGGEDEGGVVVVVLPTNSRPLVEDWLLLTAPDVAEESSAERTDAGLIELLAPSSRAAPPATCGEAIDVPLIFANAVELV